MVKKNVYYAKFKESDATMTYYANERNRKRDEIKFPENQTQAMRLWVYRIVQWLMHKNDPIKVLFT
jgi:hypothetical protein